jgi:propanol-preferring alcohol dehydrogenase
MSLSDLITAEMNPDKMPEIPKTCKAGVVVNPGPDFKVVVEDVPVPEPGPDEILIKLNATGLCFSDIHYMLEDLPMPKMSQFGTRSPGHEGAGVVVKIGTNVKNWKVGDRGGVKPTWSTCMNCEFCWSGEHETYCQNSESTGLSVAGTYQQYILSPANYTSRIPDKVDDFTAGPIMCSGSTIYSSVRSTFEYKRSRS